MQFIGKIKDRKTIFKANSNLSHNSPSATMFWNRRHFCSNIQVRILGTNRICDNTRQWKEREHAAWGCTTRGRNQRRIVMMSNLVSQNYSFNSIFNSYRNNNLSLLQLEFRQNELETHTASRKVGLSKATIPWINKASQTFLEHHRGRDKQGKPRNAPRLRSYQIHWHLRKAESA